CIRDRGKAYADIDEVKTFTFRVYTSAGWHTLAVFFTNDAWEPEKGIDRNLLVKDIEIYDISPKGQLKIKKELEKNYSFSNLMLSYFKFLGEEYKNDLIKFFKLRFNIESLRDLMSGEYNLEPLIKDIDIANLTKRAIFAPAPTKFKLKLKVPWDGIKFIFSYGIMPEAWNKPGDGVEFVVRLDTEEGRPQEVLFSRYINPKVNFEDRKWHLGEVDLRKFKGKEINLVFETKGSAISPVKPFDDYLYDYAVWSD
ncbi:MAG: hypothetical protein N2Z79_04525, partial [Candidatus Omnitrophica bacterium]|nr:hypothetical protein [Candidatus Omnitrophota bacterium]